ncbi:MAG: hypothetical protein WCI74_18910, partial [Actinomycetes bacterium]
LLTFTNASGTFRMESGGSRWWSLDTGSYVESRPNAHKFLHFVAHVSPVATAGKWHARGVVTDVDGQSASVNKNSCGSGGDCFSVNFSQYVQVNNTEVSQNFGSFLPNTVSGGRADPGTVVSNTPVSLSLNPGPFRNGQTGHQITNQRGNFLNYDTLSDNAKNDQYLMACRPNVNWADSGATMLENHSTVIPGAGTSATRESGATPDLSCGIRVGSAPLGEYSATVSVSVSAN